MRELNGFIIFFIYHYEQMTPGLYYTKLLLVSCCILILYIYIVNVYCVHIHYEVMEFKFNTNIPGEVICLAPSSGQAAVLHSLPRCKLGGSCFISKETLFVT